MANIFSSILHWFQGSHPKVQAALDQAAHIAQVALPIVEQIAALTPTRTDDEIIAAYKHFAVPVIDAQVSGGIGGAGAALLSLGTAVVQAQFPGLPVSLVQTGVQLAVTAYKAQKG